MSKEDNTFSIRYESKGKLPSLPFEQVKNDILKKKYELSLVSATKNLAQSLNIKYRKKDYIPNILSFPLTKETGEIFLHTRVIKKQYKDFNMSYEDYILFLFIHGCLHLKGYEHGQSMEKMENFYKKKYNIVEK
jgi:probable rRNA maturation factor